MSNIWTSIGAAVLPGIVLLVYVYIQDKYQREPILQLLKGVLFGVLSCAVALGFAYLLGYLGYYPEDYKNVKEAFAHAFFAAAVPEECAKLLMLWLLVRKNKYFDEFFDGIVYAVTVGLGFAMIENILYVLRADNWQAVAITRAIYSVPGHYMFAVLMGYFYSYLHFRHGHFMLRPLVLFVPILFHGLYDAILMSGKVIENEWISGAISFVFIVFFIWAQTKARSAIRKLLAKDKELMESGAIKGL